MEESGAEARRMQTQIGGWRSSLTTDAIDFSEGMASIIIRLALKGEILVAVLNDLKRPSYSAIMGREHRRMGCT